MDLLENQCKEDHAQIEALVNWADVLYHENKTQLSQLTTYQNSLYQNDLEMVGVKEVPKEAPLQSAITFFKNIMKLEPTDSDVSSAYHKGARTQIEINGQPVTLPHKLVVMCSPSFKSMVINKVSMFKDYKDPEDGHKCFMGPLLPEAYKAARDQYKDEIKKLRQDNEGKEPKDQVLYRMSGTQLIVRNVPRKEFLTPLPQEGFQSIEGKYAGLVIPSSCYF